MEPFPCFPDGGKWCSGCGTPPGLSRVLRLLQVRGVGRQSFLLHDFQDRVYAGGR